jgi:protein SCO1
MQRFVTIGIALFAAFAVSASSTFGGDRGSATERQAPWGKDYFPNPPVVTQDGKTLRFYNDLIKDKIVVISFIYTSCADLCPLTTARLAQIQEKLGDSVGRDIFFYSITVDPERDSPEVLKKHAEAFHIGPGWLFLTGKPEDIASIRYKLGDRRRKLSEHTQEVRLGNDATGEWERASLMGDLDRLVMSIRGMDPSWREQVQAPQDGDAGNSVYQLSDEPGQALFKKLCAACHTVGVGDRVGPDLQGVTARRDRSWLSSFITAPEKAHVRKDPTALALAAKFPGVRMPNLGLTKNDTADLITYLEAQSKSVEAEKSAAAGHGHHHHHHEHRH